MPRPVTSRPRARAVAVRGGVTRERLVGIGREIVESEGARSLTIRRLAEAVDRTQPAVYAHFASKDDLLAAVVVDGFVALGDALARVAGRDDALAAVVSAYVRFGLRRPRLYELMFVAPPSIEFAAGDATPQPARVAFALLAEAFAPSGDVEVVRRDTMTEVAWAALHGFVTLAITRRVRPGAALGAERLALLTAAIVALREGCAPRERHVRPA